MRTKNHAEIADKINERISEDGWHVEPSDGGVLAVVAPSDDPKRQQCTQWVKFVVLVPANLFDSEQHESTD